MRLRLLVFLILSLSGTLLAQSGDTLRILRIDVSNYPTVRVYVRAYCAGQQVTDLTTTTVQVVDGGINRTFTVNCPIKTEPMSVAFVLDRSNSVAGTPWYRLQQAVHEFITLMQNHGGANDEVGLVVFNDIAELAWPMTPNKNDLLLALYNIFPFGNTAVWDGAMLGLYEVATRGTNANKSVVVFTDGGDNSSASDLPDVIAYARSLGIPVHVIGLTKFTKPEEVRSLKMLADSTGGIFVELNHPNDIIPVFNALASIITGGANDCVIEYKTECADGSLRQVEVTAEICGKTIKQRASYYAPIDPNLPSVKLEIGAAVGYVNGDLYVPVLISPQGSSATISDLHFKVLEAQPLKYMEVIHTPYFGKHFIVNAGLSVDTLNVRLTGSATLDAPDTLLVIRYKASDIGKDTTLPFLLFYLDKKTQQCMRLEISNAQFSILTRPVLQLDCELDSVHVKWDEQKAKYVPDRLQITGTIRNNGQKMAGNPRMWISVPAGFRIIGFDTLVVASPGIASGGSAQVTFTAQILPSDSARDIDICVGVVPDSGITATCCTRITIERGKPALRMWCEIPKTIQWVDSLNAYEPREFPVIVNVINASPIVARASEAWIHIPDGFDLVGSTPINTRLIPETLTQADTGRVTWWLRPRDRMTSDTLEFCVKTTAGLDTAVCCQKMYITSSPVRAALACVNPRVVKFDEQTGKFDPPQFLVSTMVRNTSGNPMIQAQGRLTYPSWLSLAPGDFAIKNLPNGAVIPPGDSAIVVWTLVPTKPPTGNGQLCIDISASNYSGGRCCVPLYVETNNAIPVLACSLSGPDTIRYTETGYQPNPMTLRIKIDNLGTTPARGVYAALLQGAELSIDPSDQALKLATDSLSAGSSVETTFKVRILDRSVTRFDTVRVSVYASNGGGIVCEKIILIEAVRGPKLELSCTGPDALVFVDSLNAYAPSPFTIRMTATNTGNAVADSVVAEFLTSPNIELVAGEQAAKFLNPMTLAVSANGTASWQVNAVPRSFTRTDTLRVQARIKGRVLFNAEPCEIPVFIPAARKSQLELSCTPISELQVNGDKYSPDPFAFRLRVKNTGDAKAFDVNASVLSFGRLQLAAGETPTKTQYSIDAINGEAEFSWSFTATPLMQGDSVEVCFRVSSRFNNDLFCCTKIWLPPLMSGSVTVSCTTIDTVRIDPTTGLYPNPITVSTHVTNPTSVTIDSVRATLIVPGGLQLAAGERADKVVYGLAPQQSADLQWLLDVLRDTSSVLKSKRIRIQYFAHGEILNCERTLVVVPPPDIDDTTAMEIACTTPDSILYVDSQIGLQPNPFTVLVDIVNKGNAPLNGIIARIELPAGITLSSGEVSSKALGLILQPGKRAALSWSCVPGLGESTRTLSIRITVDASGVTEQECLRNVVIQGIVRRVRLVIPRDNILRNGQTIDVPVYYTNAEGAVVNQFQFAIEYDAALVHIEKIFQGGTLTELWNPLVFNNGVAGRVSVSGAHATPLADAGTLFRFRLQAVSGDGTSNPFGVKTSELRIESPVFPTGIRVEVDHGAVVTSGDCVIPLNASQQFRLRPNRPNPFNPSTVLSYEIGAGDPVHVTLEVLDTFGRFVRSVDDALREPGVYNLPFMAETLPAGMYFYRATVQGQTLWGRMILSK